MYLKIRRVFCVAEGGITNAPLPYDTINPYLLSKRHRLTELIIFDAHLQVGHNKVRDTLNNIRSTYWIPQGRSIVKRIVYQCRLCRKYEGKPYKYPDQPPLPGSRLSYDFAFSNI